MRKKTVEKVLSFEGTYSFYLDDFEDIAVVLNEAYGSYGIETEDFELEDVAELSQLKPANVTKLSISGPADHNAEGWLNGLKFWVYPQYVQIYLRNRDDYKALGVAARIEQIIQGAKTGTGEKHNTFATVTLTRRDGSRHEETKGLPVSVTNALVVKEVKAPIKVESVAEPVSIAEDRRGFLKRNKDKIILSLLSAALGAISTILVRLAMGK